MVILSISKDIDFSYQSIIDNGMKIYAPIIQLPDSWFQDSFKIMLPKMGGGPTASPAQPPSSTGGPPPPSPATFDLMGNPVGGNNTQQPSPAGGIVLGGGNTAVGHSNGGGLTIMGVGSVRPPTSNGGVGSGTNLGGKLLDFFVMDEDL